MHAAPFSIRRGRFCLVVALALVLALTACSIDPSALVPAPEGVRLVEHDGAIDVHWLPVATAGVTAYQVFLAEGESSQAPFEMMSEVDANTHTATISGLTNFTPYRFTVRTVTAGGESDPSEPVWGAPFSVDAVPIAGFESDAEGAVAVLVDGSRFRLHTREEMTATDGPEPPDFELGSVAVRPGGLAAAALGTSDAPLPDTFTLSAFQTPIRHQERRGTCQTFTVVAAMEAAYRHLGFGSRDLSEQFASHLYRITTLRDPAPTNAEARENTLGMRGGGSTAGVFGRLMRYRIPLDTLDPYVGASSFENPNQDGDVPRIDPGDETVAQAIYNEWNLQDEPTSYQIPATLTHTPFPREALVEAEYGITGFSKVPSPSRHDPTWYEQVLVSGHEIALGFCFNGGGSDGDGVWRTGDDEGCGGHAVLLIGYDRTDPDDPVFIAKNSWGGTAFQLMEYAYVTDPDSFLSAHVLGGVTDPGRGNVHPQVALGRWDLVYDGNLATLDINRLSDFYQPSSIGGLQDRRLGTLFGASANAYRVNGAANVGASGAAIDVDFHVDFADPALDYETLSGVHFTGYVTENEPSFMAGTFQHPTAPGTFGFYAHKDGPVASVFPGPGNEPASYRGTWRILGLGTDGHLVVDDVLPTGVFSGVSTHDAASVSGMLDLGSETITFDLADASGITGSVTAHLHNGDPGTASGTITYGGHAAGIAIVRVGDEPGVEIDHVGTLREDGAIDLGATVAGFVDPGAVSIEWSYQVGAGGSSTVFATSSSGEVFTANLPCDDLIVTAAARDTSRGLEAKDVVPISCARAIETRLFHADRTASGWVNSNGKAGTAASGNVLYVGDDAFDHGYRSFLTFVWNLPSDLAVIEGAQVTIFLDGVEGTPYAVLNELRAFHADYGDTLDAADYVGYTPLPGAATLPFDGSSTFGAMTFDVTAAMQDAWENRVTRGERLQLALQFGAATDGDGQADRATFLAENSPGTTLLPYVEITYRNY
ncbi:MAG: fibronectin type III domain-containing protein [Trueperaceae bacterium]